MKRLLATFEPLSLRERGKGDGPGTRVASALRVIEPSPGATRNPLLGSLLAKQPPAPAHTRAFESTRSATGRSQASALTPKGEGKNHAHRIRHLLAIVLVAFALTLSTAAFAIDALSFQSNAQRERFQHLTGELRCMVCQDESLLASNADFAKQLRRQIFDLMQQGKSDKEIKDWLITRYSTFILYDPPLQTSTLALWFGTPAILLAGGIVVVVLLRRRTRPASAIADDPGDDW